MEYGSILKKIEEQKKDEKLSAKLFRYSGLIQAIEFFSQKLNFDQIIDAAFDFINELLTIENSAVFVINGNDYILKKTKGYYSGINLVKSNENLQRLATHHGTLLYDQSMLSRYFDTNVLEAYKVTSAIPLIMEQILYGFIFISNKTIGDLESDDYIICEALMKLFNNALENYKRYEELKKVNTELDEKVFNLFAINQSSKALLSELNLDILYNLSIDVFSELTQSSTTGFILYDEKSDKYILKAYKDINYSEPDTNFGLTSNKLARIDANRALLNMTKEADAGYFNSLFLEGTEALKCLNSLYIVLLIKNSRILGVVSLSKNVTGGEYKKSMFELIESLASASYTSLSNAQLFKRVSEQKKVIQDKLESLILLNNLMKNINSSTDIETMMQLTIKTLEISFGMEKALFVLYDKEKGVFNMNMSLNIKTDIDTIEINDDWKRVLEGDTIFESLEEGIQKYLSKPLIEDVGPASGILIVPVYIDRVDIEVIGAFIIFKFKRTPVNDDENIVTMQAIAGHIAPVLNNLFIMEKQKRVSVPNYIEVFKEDLRKSIEEAQEFSMFFEVVQIVENRDFSFKTGQVEPFLRNNFSRIYPLSYNNIFVILDNDEPDLEKKLEEIRTLGDIKVRTLAFGDDFKSFDEFIGLF